MTSSRRNSTREAGAYLCPVPTLLHARTVIETWRREYTEERAKKTLGALTPAAYAQQIPVKAATIEPGL